MITAQLKINLHSTGYFINYINDIYKQVKQHFINDNHNQYYLSTYFDLKN